MLKERPAELTAAGLWEQVDDKTGSTQCWFEITERDGIYEGTIGCAAPAGSIFL